MRTDDRKAGLLILVGALTLIAIALVMSDGWGYATVPLYLFSPIEVKSIYFDPDWDWLRPALEFFSLTRNVISLLLLLFAYGLCRYLSLLPPLLRRNRHLTAAANETPAEPKSEA